MSSRDHAAVPGKKIKGRVFDIQRFSLHDGPGIRTLVFLKGCPLRCVWCSNPESQKYDPEIMFDASKCMDCGTCIAVCPLNAIEENKTVHRINRQRCNSCGNCTEACPTRALRFSGNRMSVKTVLKEIEKDREFYDSSGGGVTFSGGEPLGQPEFLKHLLMACKSRDFHTALETCGSVKWEHFENILAYTNLFLYDVKQMDPVEHEKLTGNDNRWVLENLEKLCRIGANVIIRMPVVPGANDSEKNLTATAELVTRLGITEIHLLPYHNYGESKYRMLGNDYALMDLEPASGKHLDAPKRVFERYGLRVSIGGE
jgi:pyruvate formate lyase activating enzyme